ncbi:MAG TPA: serine hydrolase [Pirellulales bacterium]|jgi:CubicO group peptidase (beta-lactamase class C family)|nr:serine hydrolase [Pirellulales bacterium]
MITRCLMAMVICAGAGSMSAPVLLGAAETFPGAKWDTASSAESFGWSDQKLKAADDFARTLHTDAYLVVDRGTIVHQYGATSQPTNIHSMRKSILSVLMGIGLDRGQVDLSKTLVQLGIDDRGGLSAIERQATVRQLLEARSGIYHPAAYETASMKAARPARGSFAPGQHWYYNNWDFNALGTIYQKFSGKTVFEGLRDDLAGPLEFEDFNLGRDTRWMHESVSDYPAYTMRLSARDLARVGLLMSRSGRWKDRRIVSANWVTQSTSAHSSAGKGIGYGYLWWVGVDGWHFHVHFPGTVFSARGHHGQFIVVDPLRDLVIVHRVDSERDSRREVSMKQFSELLQRVLAAKIQEK